MNRQANKFKIPTDAELFETNPKVSKSVVLKYKELEKKLEKLGISTKTRYTLSHPLEGVISNIPKK